MVFGEFTKVYVAVKLVVGDATYARMGRLYHIFKKYIQNI